MEPTTGKPWSIPVREPGPHVPHRAATWVDRLPLLPTALAVAALVAGLMGALVLLDTGAATSGPEVAGDVVSRATTAAPEPTSTNVVVTSTSAPATTASTTAPSETSAPSPPPTVVSNRSGEPAGLPIRTPADLAGGWVAQVSSVPASVGAQGLARSFDAIRQTVPDAIIVRGSEWPGLRSGYWVIVRSGYDEAAAAVADCDAWGFEGRDACFARHLSADDGTNRTCWRDESGSLTGDCS